MGALDAPTEARNISQPGEPPGGPVREPGGPKRGPIRRYHTGNGTKELPAEGWRAPVLVVPRRVPGAEEERPRAACLDERRRKRARGNPGLDVRRPVARGERVGRPEGSGKGGEELLGVEEPGVDRGNDARGQVAARRANHGPEEAAEEEDERDVVNVGFRLDVECFKWDWLDRTSECSTDDWIDRASECSKDNIGIRDERINIGVGHHRI